MPTSEMMLLSSPYSENIILQDLLGYLHQTFQPAFEPGICYGNLQYKDNACYQW